jgi:5-methylcytosine-specific restriction endonuclease McrA
MAKPSAARRRIWEQQGYRCYYCAQKTRIKIPKHGRLHSNTATLDHIIPVSKGGAFGPTLNCVVACHACNSERGDKDARVFLLEKMGLA